MATGIPSALAREESNVMAMNFLPNKRIVISVMTATKSVIITSN